MYFIQIHIVILSNDFIRKSGFKPKTNWKQGNVQPQLTNYLSAIFLIRNIISIPQNHLSFQIVTYFLILYYTYTYIFTFKYLGSSW
jgi:hypothetical protein